MSAERVETEFVLTDAERVGLLRWAHGELAMGQGGQMMRSRRLRLVAFLVAHRAAVLGPRPGPPGRTPLRRPAPPSATDPAGPGRSDPVARQPRPETALVVDQRPGRGRRRRRTALARLPARSPRSTLASPVARPVPTGLCGTWDLYRPSSERGGYRRDQSSRGGRLRDDRRHWSP